MPTRQQIDSFYEFASAQIDKDETDLSMDELYCLWRAKHPTAEELSDSVTAIRAAYTEMKAGDPGRPARAMLRESCERLGLVIDE